MSQQTCAEFFTKINTDAALQQEVDAVLEGKEDMAAATALIELGAKYGYEFTAIEAAQKYQEILAITNGELNEEALENLAGGVGQASTSTTSRNGSGTSPSRGLGTPPNFSRSSSQGKRI